MQITDRRFLDTPTRSVHAATIEFWEDHPVFAWFGGTREGAPDVAIFLHNLNDEGENIILGAQDPTPRWNPILFAHKDKLWMFEKAGQFCDRWQTFIHNVTDWDSSTCERDIRNDSQTLPAGLNGPVKTKPIPTGEHSVVCGSSVETFCDWVSYMEGYIISDGKWDYAYRSKPLAVERKVQYRNPYNGRPSVSMGVIQPAIWKDVDNNAHAFFRSSGGLDCIYYSRRVQYSMGSGWISPIKTNLPNPNSGVDVVTVDGRAFLVSNPSELYRKPLVIQEIKLDDKHNPYEEDPDYVMNIEVANELVVRESIDSEDQDKCVSEELSYPYMIENDGNLHLVYTYGRSKIEYVTISI